MAFAKFNHLKIVGVCGALPGNGRSVFDIGEGLYARESIEKISSAIGAEKLYVAAHGQTASDLCFAASERLLERLGWTRDSVDALLFVSQTPDYELPATSGVLQARLGLPKDCMTLDLNLGCSGFVCGLFQAAHLIEARTCKRALLLVGDALRGRLSIEDKSLAFILSDAGTATALEYDAHTTPSAMIVRSDGSGYGHLIIPAGAARKPLSEETRVLRECEDGNRRGEEHLFMDGKAVFTFAVKEIPGTLSDVMALRDWNPVDVDAFLLHQANAYMLRYIAKRAKLPLEKFPININEYGNTNGSTIPFLLCDLSADLLREEKNIVMAGFGVGLSWGAAAMRLGGFGCADVIHV